MDNNSPQKKCATADCDGSSGFGRDKSRKDGFRRICRRCANRARVRNPRRRARDRSKLYMRKYGISLEGVEQMVKAQGGCCAGCGRPRDKLAVDHCHASGKIRAMLCWHCNTALGMVNDSKDWLLKLIRYIEAHE